MTSDLLIISISPETRSLVGAVAKILSSSRVRAICTPQASCRRSPRIEGIEEDDPASKRDWGWGERACLPLFFSLVEVCSYPEKGIKSMIQVVLLSLICSSDPFCRFAACRFNCLRTFADSQGQCKIVNKNTSILKQKIPVKYAHRWIDS